MRANLEQRSFTMLLQQATRLLVRLSLTRRAASKASRQRGRERATQKKVFARKMSRCRRRQDAGPTSRLQLQQKQPVRRTTKSSANHFCLPNFAPISRLSPPSSSTAMFTVNTLNTLRCSERGGRIHFCQDNLFFVKSAALLPVQALPDTPLLQYEHEYEISTTFRKHRPNQR